MPPRSSVTFRAWQTRACTTWTAPQPRKCPKSCWTRCAASSSQARANVHEGLHRLARAATDAYNEARGRVARFLAREFGRRGRLHLRRHVGDQPAGSFLRRSARARRRDPALGSRAPQQPGALAKARRAARHRAALPADDAGGAARSRVARLRAHPSLPAGRAHPLLERHRCADRRRPGRRGSACGRRQGHAGRSPARSARTARRTQARRRFLCLLRSQDLWADRHRRAVGPPRSPRGRCRRS